VAEFEKFGTVLEKCLRDLRVYADSKRKDFPRFFFLSNRELLDVLANGAEPDKVSWSASGVGDGVVGALLQGLSGILRFFFYLGTSSRMAYHS